MTGMMQTVDHEAQHALYNKEYIQQAILNGQSSTETVRSFVEGRVYLWQKSVMSDYDYSECIQTYIKSQTEKLPFWMIEGKW